MVKLMKWCTKQGKKLLSLRETRGSYCKKVLFLWQKSQIWVKQCRNDLKFEVNLLGDKIRPSMSFDLRFMTSKGLVVERNKKNATFIFMAQWCQNGLKFDMEPPLGIIRPSKCLCLRNRVSRIVVAKRVCFVIRRMKLGETISEWPKTWYGHSFNMNKNWWAICTLFENVLDPISPLGVFFYNHVGFWRLHKGFKTIGESCSCFEVLLAQWISFWHPFDAKNQLEWLDVTSWMFFNVEICSRAKMTLLVSRRSHIIPKKKKGSNKERRMSYYSNVISRSLFSWICKIW